MSASSRFGGHNSYAEYLTSNHWYNMRNRWCSRRAACYACDQTSKRCQIHHVSYENLGNEQANDFLVVCPDCHERIHEALSELLPDWGVGYQAQRTFLVFEKLFGRTIGAAYEKYDHLNRWKAFRTPTIAEPINRKKKKKNKKQWRGKLTKGQYRDRSKSSDACQQPRKAKPKPPKFEVAKALARNLPAIPITAAKPLATENSLAALVRQRRAMAGS